jgi:mannose-6-phosphate isomerase-like protein (cupin superfamily)
MFSQVHGTWGERMLTFAWDGGIVTLLFLVPNQRCSYHSHTTCWNRFTVISGKLGVKTDKGHTTVLTQKQMFDVEPGVLHEFQTYEVPAIVEEIAYVKYNPEDIRRIALGGDVLEPEV